MLERALQAVAQGQGPANSEESSAPHRFHCRWGLHFRDTLRLRGDERDEKLGGHSRILTHNNAKVVPPGPEQATRLNTANLDCERKTRSEPGPRGLHSLLEKFTARFVHINISTNQYKGLSTSSLDNSLKKAVEPTPFLPDHY